MHKEKKKSKIHRSIGCTPAGIAHPRCPQSNHPTVPLAEFACLLGGLLQQLRGCAMLSSLESLHGLRLVTLFNVLWTASAFSFGSSAGGIRSDSQVAAHGAFQSGRQGRPTRSNRPQRMGLHMEQQPHINESEVKEENMAELVCLSV